MIWAKTTAASYQLLIVCRRNQRPHAWLGIKCGLSADDSLCLTSSSLWLRNVSTAYSCIWSTAHPLHHPLHSPTACCWVLWVLPLKDLKKISTEQQIFSFDTCKKKKKLPDWNWVLNLFWQWSGSPWEGDEFACLLHVTAICLMTLCQSAVFTPNHVRIAQTLDWCLSRSCSVHCVLKLTTGTVWHGIASQSPPDGGEQRDPQNWVYCPVGSRWNRKHHLCRLQFLF